MKTDNPKIYIFTAHECKGKRYFAFAACTTWSKTCREAKLRFAALHRHIPLNDIKTRFAK